MRLQAFSAECDKPATRCPRWHAAQGLVERGSLLYLRAQLDVPVTREPNVKNIWASPNDLLEESTCLSVKLLNESSEFFQ